MSQLRAVLRDQRGFTLTELLVVATVLGMILAGVVLIQMQGQQAYLFGSHRVEVQQNNRSALELMVRDLRSAASVTALGSGTDLTVTTCQDPYPSSAPTTPCLPADVISVRYQLSGTTLNRIVNGTTTPLIGGVQTLAMTYYAYDPATNTTSVTTTPASVKLVRVQLVTGTEDYVGAGSPANRRATMESLVRLRNIP
ncbi:MAG TPA: prepilin-type N-terminal cleavage/methylation domain-containing protein [Methylomirabilota bacterium]|jgi:prepilin-type N-terminal cleavage/methylation domain-containing protein|nr:prepilin-type N-terminal cleavage/methylation domain-containing protein [Methylomirabilota bacterium]